MKGYVYWAVGNGSDGMEGRVAWCGLKTELGALRRAAELFPQPTCVHIGAERYEGGRGFSGALETASRRARELGADHVTIYG